MKTDCISRLNVYVNRPVVPLQNLNYHYVVSVLRSSALIGNPILSPAASAIIWRYLLDDFALLAALPGLLHLRDSWNNIGFPIVKSGGLSAELEHSIYEGLLETCLVCFWYRFLFLRLSLRDPGSEGYSTHVGNHFVVLSIFIRLCLS